MSASWALIKFKRTGNIYMGCYEGTSDIMNPYICTPEECWDEKWEAFCSIDTCRKLARGRSYAFPDDVPDLDDVQVYSDYGGGFYWDAVGSESIKMIKNPLDGLCELDFDKITDGKPDWVSEFEKKLERWVEEVGTV